MVDGKVVEKPRLMAIVEEPGRWIGDVSGRMMDPASSVMGRMAC